ncbi:hypothetical protein BDM02DRAFT_3119610 [Thelephora ganbajun]|uniref:Uncharacterized protein n=1 Tax=Thelephora ganbajun TaxID=370292 RepID=A0ACB6Z890_THEGA|nr:hypothetical protein BDM02DRAFT_3119610 [Thelephora ganbajun]
MKNATLDYNVVMTFSKSRYDPVVYHFASVEDMAKMVKRYMKGARVAEVDAEHRTNLMDRFSLTPLFTVLIDSAGCLLSHFLFDFLSRPASRPITTYRQNRSQP